MPQADEWVFRWPDKDDERGIQFEAWQNTETGEWQRRNISALPQAAPAAPPATSPYAGVAFDPNLQWVEKAKETALEASKFMYQKTLGNVDRAREAAAGVLAFLESTASRYGFTPAFDTDELYKLLRGPEIPVEAGGDPYLHIWNARPDIQKNLPMWMGAGKSPQEYVQEWLKIEQSPDILAVGRDPVRVAQQMGYQGGIQGVTKRSFDAVLAPFLNTPTLAARDFILRARASPDVLSSIRAEAGLPTTGLDVTKGLPQPTTAEVQASPRFRALTETPFFRTLAGRRKLEWPDASRGLAQPGEVNAQVLTPVNMNDPAEVARYQQQYGDMRPAAKETVGAAPEVSTLIPAANQIPLGWWSEQSPDVQRVVKSLYPGLTEEGFQQPFLTAMRAFGGTARPPRVKF